MLQNILDQTGDALTMPFTFKPMIELKILQGATVGEKDLEGVIYPIETIKIRYG